MFSSIRKIVAGLGLVALCVAPAVAGQFFVSTSGGQYGGTAVVPNAGNCGQVCYSSNMYSWSVASGPLGMQYLNGYNGTSGQHLEYVIRGGSVAPGSYSCLVDAGNGGYASVTVNW